MSMPGWYPDPSGQQGQFRYWNGSDWSAETTPNPQQTPPPGAAPYQAGNSGAGRGRVAAILIGVVAVIVAIVVVMNLSGRGANRPVAEDTNSSTPDVSAWDETSSATPDPSNPDNSAGTLIDCPNGESSSGEMRDGRLYGGGISVVSLGGWRPGGIRLAWVHNLSAQSKSITQSWFSVSAVGALSVVDGFEVPETSARQMMSCFASSIYYSGVTGRKNITAEEVTIDGKKGYHLATEIYVNNQGPNIAGDRVDVVVLDTGSPESLAIYFSSATIGDKATIAEVDKARASIKVGS